MKRLIVISVVFALVAGSAFAVDLGGDVIGAVNVLSKDGAADDAEAFNGGLGRIRIEGSGDVEIGVGTIGGWVRFEKGGETTNLSAQPWENPNSPFAAVYGLAWWQPIDWLKIQIGGNPDGHYDTSHIGRYGFYAQPNELGMVNSDGNWGNTSFDKAVFGGGFGFEHFALIFNFEGLNINVALPLNEGAVGDDNQIAATFKKSLFQVNYNADFGAIHVTYQGINGKYDPADLDNTAFAQAGKLFASAYLGSLVEGLGLELGVGFGLAAEDALKSPLGIALGVRYDADAFGIKLRSIFDLPMEDEEKVAIRVDLLPSYALSDDVTVFGDIGIYLDGQEDQFAWHLAPYVRIGSEWGPGFYAGLKFDNGSGVKDSKVNIAIPVGIIAKF